MYVLLIGSLSFSTCSFGHSVVCSSSIYEILLPLWYLKLFLHDERQSRVNTVDYVNDLRHQLTATKQGITDEQPKWKDFKGTFEHYLFEVMNKTLYDK